jgi:hypothetical protein
VSTVALLAKQARLQGLMVGSRRQQQDYVAALEQSGGSMRCLAPTTSNHVARESH